ncbi:MAG: VacB/RNase II family 3'-5' exoribonuclease [Phycisphaeraceae bacterium]|nr:VacB/RNase II family 3'-5' exoribonuclease [Phycisphaeraceae bacterium]
MPLRYRARILDHLSHDDYRPADTDDLARLLRVPVEDRPAFDEAIDALASEGSIEIGDDERVRLPRYGDVIEGKIKVNPRGFAFVIPDTPTREGDLFIPAGQTGDAISGDRVRCRVVRRSGSWSERDRRGTGVRGGAGDRDGGGRGGRDFGRSSGRGGHGGGSRGGFGAGGSSSAGGRGSADAAGSRPVGRVIEVIERASRTFAGTLSREGRQWMVQPDGRRLRDPIIVRDAQAKGAKEGDKVVVDIISFPTETKYAEGVVTEVLGESGRPDVETQAVIAAFELPGPFPEEVVEEARSASRGFAAKSDGPWPDRLDLTGELTFTIDPPDARDFDDAITIHYDESRDEWTLGVHIADVSSFVPPGGALDREAQARGNSVYLPRVVIPMLPEVLSNGVCSLQEGVTRFTKSAIITLDGKGRPGHVRVANSAIRSAKRLTYLEAQALIDGRTADAATHARTETEPSDDLVHALRLCDRLAKIIEKRRRAQGMITLALPEVELVHDDAGHVIDAVPEDDAFTHRLIEMFMVEANEAVTRIFADLEVPLLRRIHPEPSFGDLEELRQFARTAKFRVPEEPTRHDLQALLEATRDREDARAIHFAVLRTLSKASYSPALIGHYALASDHYAHFTSPIRRYPDLTVHRALDAYLELTENGAAVPGGRRRRSLAQGMHDDPRVFDELELAEVGRHCSETEVRAEEAERDLRSFLVLQLLREKHMGDEFDAIVTGVLGSGAVFASLEKYLVDGVVRLEAAIRRGDGESTRIRKPERWTVNERDGRLVNVRSGASIGLGDHIRVGILSIDLPSRTMELALAGPLRSRRAAEPEDAGTAADGANAARAAGADDPDDATPDSARSMRGKRAARSDEDSAPNESDSGPEGSSPQRRASRGIGLGHERDPRRDLLSREQRVEHKGHRRGFKQGRRGRRGR